MNKEKFIEALREDVRINPEYTLIFVLNKERYVATNVDSYGDGTIRVKLEKQDNRENPDKE